MFGNIFFTKSSSDFSYFLWRTPKNMKFLEGEIRKSFFRDNLW